MALIETYEKITLDMLTEDSVSILKRTFAEINGSEVQIGDNWRRAYVNSVRGRQEIAEFLGDTPQLESVLKMWGDTPTVEEEIPQFQQPESQEENEESESQDVAT